MTRGLVEARFKACCQCVTPEPEKAALQWQYGQRPVQVKPVKLTVSHKIPPCGSSLEVAHLGSLLFVFGMNCFDSSLPVLDLLHVGDLSCFLDSGATRLFSSARAASVSVRNDNERPQEDQFTNPDADNIMMTEWVPWLSWAYPYSCAAFLV